MIVKYFVITTYVLYTVYYIQKYLCLKEKIIKMMKLVSIIF